MKRIAIYLLFFLFVGCNRQNKTSSMASTSVDSIKNGLSNLEYNNLKEASYCICKNIQLAFVSQSDSLILVIKTGNDLKNRDSVIKKIGGFEKDQDLFIENGSKIFKYGNELFYRAQITQRGMAYDNWDVLYHIDKENCDLDTVIIKYAGSFYRKYLKQNERIWKGEGRVYHNDTIKGYFEIWNDTDAMCCPSIGEISVSYKIKKGKENFIMEPDTNSFKFKKY